MERLLEKHQDKITGMLNCFDRILLKGYLPFPTGRSMEAFLNRHGILYKDFKRFVLKHSERVKDHAQKLAEQAGRPVIPIKPWVRKEDRAREIAERDGIRAGLVCVFTAVEACTSFVLRPGKGKPQLKRARRKCLHLYFYLIDREFGLIHVRLQTWFPFTIQICLNGHEWLARKMDRYGIAYERIDNAFWKIDDVARAQRLADNMLRKNWLPALEAIARRVNPLLGDLLDGIKHYWVIDQAEFATDITFKDRASLEGLYQALVRHASLCFGAEDIMRFLGRKLHGAFKGEVQTDFKKRVLGARIIHRVKRNWIKMYDKQGVVLRIETVINAPREFKVYRQGIRRGEDVMGWFPMAKGIANFRRYGEVCRQANQRYLNALAVVDDPRRGYQELKSLCSPVTYRGRRRRGLNPLRPDDVALFGAVLKGEHAIKGFQNRHVVKHLYSSRSRNRIEARRRSLRVTRLIQLLRAHRLIAKIPRSQRYRVTQRGAKLMAAAVHLAKQDMPQHLNAIAA